MRSVWLILSACLLNAESSLTTLIDSARQNDRIAEYSRRVDAAGLGHEVVKSSFLPRIDGIANAAFVDKTGGFDAKRTYTAGVKGEYVVFDGHKRENRLNQTKALENAAKHDLDALKKEMALEVIERYYELQNLRDEIGTMQMMREQLEAQLVRLEKFKSAGLASEDSLMRMRSELSHTLYRIEDLRYQADVQKSALETMTNQTIGELAPAQLREPAGVQGNETDTLKALRFSRDAKLHEAKQNDAASLPLVKVEDQYLYFDYYNDPIAQMRVDTQNKLILSMSMNLIDFSAASTAKEAAMAQAQAQTSALAYAQNEAKRNVAMASRAIERSRVLIEAASSALDASAKTQEAIRQKYEARIVDHVVYLDALRTHTDAVNRLTRSQRTLHYAYAAYYYYAGLDPREFVQ